MKTKNVLILAVCFPLAGLFSSCDDGRIYEEQIVIPQEGLSLKMTGNISNIGDWPSGYSLVVAGFNEGSEYENAQGVSDLAGATCTSQLGTVWYDVCLPQIPDANILPAQESAPAMLVALASGRVDLVCTDMPTGQAALIAYPQMRLLDFSGSDDDFQVSQEEINIGISVRKGNTELLDAINGVLATLTVEDFNRMMDEAISVQPLAQ